MILYGIANNIDRRAVGYMKNCSGTLSRALIANGQVSLAVLDTTNPVREAARRHGFKEGSLAVFGKTFTAAAYLCGWLKDENSSLTVSVDGDGDFGRISVSGDGAMNLRGYVGNPDCKEGRLGKGTLTVIRDDGDRLPFAGSVPLVSEETEENFTDYFLTSEQRKTGVALSVVLAGGEAKFAGGAFLQALPFADDGALALIEREMPALKQLLGQGDTEGIFRRFGAEERTEREVKFSCRCSLNKAEALILAMGEADALALCDRERCVLVHCEYCNTDYRFNKDRVKELFKEHEER